MANEKLSPAAPRTKAKPKRVAIYARVSTGDQHLETQLLDLREMAKQRGFEIAHVYSDIISGSKAKRPGLDQLLADARRHRFDIVLVAAFDRVARSVRHFLEVLDELAHLGIEFVSLRENIDTGGPLGRAIVVIVGAIAELEKSLIVERVRAGMRRAKLEGRRIGRVPLNIDRAQVVADRLSGMSLTAVAKRYRVSRATVCRLVNEAGGLKKASVSQPGNEQRVVSPTGSSNLRAAA
jgi:DNA invertase Pin-like site-specific DNA recombinase